MVSFYDIFLLSPKKINDYNTYTVGGFGQVVKIDESKFGRRKYHRGHRVEGQWVFGGVQRETAKLEIHF